MKHRFPAKHSRGRSRMTSSSEKQLLAASLIFFCLFFFFSAWIRLLFTQLAPLSFICFPSLHTNLPYVCLFKHTSNIFQSTQILLLTQHLWLNVYCHTFSPCSLVVLIGCSLRSHFFFFYLNHYIIPLHLNLIHTKTNPHSIMPSKWFIELFKYPLNPVWVSSLAITTSSNDSACLNDGWQILLWPVSVNHRSLQERPVAWFYDVNIILATELWPACSDGPGPKPKVQHLLYPATQHPLVMLQKGSRAL